MGSSLVDPLSSLPCYLCCQRPDQMSLSPLWWWWSSRCFLPSFSALHVNSAFKSRVTLRYLLLPKKGGGGEGGSRLNFPDKAGWWMHECYFCPQTKISALLRLFFPAPLPGMCTEFLKLCELVWVLPFRTIASSALVMNMKKGAYFCSYCSFHLDYRKSCIGKKGGKWSVVCGLALLHGSYVSTNDYS